MYEIHHITNCTEMHETDNHHYANIQLRMILIVDSIQDLEPNDI